MTVRSDSWQVTEVGTKTVTGIKRDGGSSDSRREPKREAARLWDEPAEPQIYTDRMCMCDTIISRDMGQCLHLKQTDL